MESLHVLCSHLVGSCCRRLQGSCSVPNCYFFRGVILLFVNFWTAISYSRIPASAIGIVLMYGHSWSATWWTVDLRGHCSGAGSQNSALCACLCATQCQFCAAGWWFFGCFCHSLSSSADTQAAAVSDCFMKLRSSAIVYSTSSLDPTSARKQSIGRRHREAGVQHQYPQHQQRDDVTLMVALCCCCQ